MNGKSLHRNRKVFLFAFIIGPILIAAFLFVVSRQMYAEQRQAMKLVSANDGLLALNRIRSLIAEMQAAEDQLLASLLEANESKVNMRDAICTGLLCLSAVVVAGAGVLLFRIRQLQSIITICAWTQRVNYNRKWMRMEDFLWQRFRLRVSHGISEEAFEGVMGMLGKNLTVSDNPQEKVDKPKTQPDADPRN